MVGDGSCLPVTAVGSAPDYFRLPNVLVAPQMIHNLLSIRQLLLTILVPSNLTPLVLL